MKKTILLLAAAFLAGSSTDAVAEVNIGTVDMNKIFDGYWRTVEAKAKMAEVQTGIKRDLDERTEKRKALEAEITKMNEDLKKTELSAQKQDDLKKQREVKIGQWQALMKELETVVREKDKAVADQMQRIRNGLLDEIKKVVNEKVRSENYDLVFDTSGNSINNVPIVMHAKKSYDFTDAILNKLNADKPKGGVSAPPPEVVPEKKDK